MEHLNYTDSFSFVFCLAGKGSRFLKDGIYQPKFLLELNSGDEILKASIKAFNLPKEIKFFLIINNKHKPYINHINKIMSSFSNDYEIIMTPDTNGQAETASLALDFIKNDNWIFFFNGDTILKDRNLNKTIDYVNSNKEISGFIDVFYEQSANYSYVKVNSNMYVEKIAEKIVISKYATSGLYGFCNKETFFKYYKKLNFAEDEIYISDIYELMIVDNLKIKIGDLFSKAQTIVLGTPKEYKNNKFKF